MKNTIVRNTFLCAVAFALASCATVTKPGSDVTLENLRSFEISFVDQFAVPGKRFDAAAFDAKVAEGNAKFQDAIKNEKFTARKPVLRDLANQFKAEAAHLRKKASTGKITKALAAEMKRDINDNFNNAIAKKQNKPAKPRSKERKKSSELDSVLDQVNDSTVADAKKELQALLADAKGNSATFFQQNAQKLEERLILVSKGELDQDDFNFFVENQKRAAQIFIDSQPPQEQERAERLTIHILEVAATKIVPVLIAAAL